jgi:hypothetical protein
LRPEFPGLVISDSAAVLSRSRFEGLFLIIFIFYFSFVAAKMII